MMMIKKEDNLFCDGLKSTNFTNGNLNLAQKELEMNEDNVVHNILSLQFGLEAKEQKLCILCFCLAIR